ncbi:MAG TPA: hypothetical protein VFN80_03940 [Acidothermaceae bacterium]|nr:hypothetical protein [Acidothermaceae bacterium]
MNTPHPELEELAGLIDDLGDNAGDGRADVRPSDVEAHVAGCARCTADLAALRGVRATLRSLPPVPMPDDVAQRIETALRGAAATAGDADSAAAETPPTAAISVLPAAGSSRRSARRGSSTGLPNFSVAAAVTVLLVIALGVGLGVALKNGGDSNKGSSTSAAASDAGSIVTASGTDYTQSDIQTQVAGLLLARVPDAHAAYKGLAPLAAAQSSAAAEPSAPAAAGSAGAGAAGGASTPKPTASSTVESAPSAGSAPRPVLQSRTPYSGPLGAPAQLQACVQALLDQPATPVLVDYAYYAGKPATIIVLKDPADPSTLDVYVEADTADCAKAGDVTFVAFIRNAS